ncbi:ABC transporter ATP-binding protein [candidate division WOR-3 bacterium]|nr:ABC transporter ATP-binding protein [candidate division WOR-3 bacterium]
MTAEVRRQKAEGRTQKGGSLRIVFEFWRRRPGWAIGLFAGTVVVTAVSIVFPYILRIIVDGIERGVTQPELVRLVLLLVGFGFLRVVGEVLLPFSRARINELYQWKVRSDVFRRALDMGHTFSAEYPTGDVMERLDHDMGELSWFACSGLFRFAAAGLTVVFALVVMVRMNPLLTLVTVLPLGLAVLVWLKLGPRVYSWFMRWRQKISEINNQLEAAFTGIRLAKSYSMEERLGQKFRSTLDGRVGVAMGEARTEAKIDIIYMAIAGVATLLVLWIGGVQVVHKSLTLGAFVAFNAYILMLVGPMFDIGNLFVSGRRAQGAAERIDSLRQHPPEVASPADAARPAAGELRLNHASFAYGTRTVLEDAEMVFAPGQKVGIAGTVGSGKSTVFRLLFRMADPSQGSVTLSGQDIRQLDLDAYRRLFGYAPQEATLFSDTVRGNIVFGRENVGDAELQAAVAGAEFSADVAGFPKGLDEVLGERGTRLSGGQKERVAIARALVNRPPVMVFDDATSALDAETEKELVNRMMNQLPGITVIIVSHRLSVLSVCDWVYVLDAGKVREQGTHADLLARQGLYWKLYQRQLVSEELERL